MIGVVADDITGANDIGVMFSKEGCQTVVASLEGAIPDDGVDVAVIDTDSRLNSPTTAYAKTREAVHRLASRGYKRYFIKTCSVFRGNIGATFDAALDELNTSFACIILGFPKNGRTTVDGVHYVRGVKLEES